MPFKKGQSGNPGGRAKHRTVNGRSVAELARDHTEEALKTLVDIMRDSGAPAAARVSAADRVLNRGWGQAPQTVTVDDKREPRDLSGLSDEQLEVIEQAETIIATLSAEPAGNC